MHKPLPQPEVSSWFLRMDDTRRLVGGFVMMALVMVTCIAMMKCVGGKARRSYTQAGHAVHASGS